MAQRVLRITTYLLLAVLGAVTAVASAVVQSGWFPFGLLLALAGVSALFYGGAKLTGKRAGAAVPTATWLLTVIWLSMSRPEGDSIFPADIGPYLYLLIGALSGVICCTLPQFPGSGDSHARLGK